MSMGTFSLQFSRDQSSWVHPQMMSPKPHLQQRLAPPKFLRLQRAVTKVMSQRHPGDLPAARCFCKQRLLRCPLNSRLLAFDKAPGFPALPPDPQKPRISSGPTSHLIKQRPVAIPLIEGSQVLGVWISQVTFFRA